ncbi:MAG: MoxR family ATPase [Niameybacter sp.]|uniref:AAA family ATPase n=1 Tax=Niameybacter sp. TaxID=2033640 RepID=UPI002FC959EF
MKTNQEVMERIVGNIEQVMLGKREAIEMVVLTLMCKGHILLEDVPGVGKTTLVGALSKTIEGTFNRIQFTPDVLPSDLVGFSMYNPKLGIFEYQKGALISQFILADEINRTPPKTQSSLLEVMEEGQITVDGKTYEMPKPFMVMATQNPVEHLGTFPLPEAQLDRFFMKLSIGYPGYESEVAMLTRFKETNPLYTLKAVATVEEVLAVQDEIQKVYVHEGINRLIVDIVSRTRKQDEVLLGASPRGSLNILRAAQGWAFYEGRDYVIPDDVIKMAPYILKHRLTLRHEAKLRQVTSEEIILYILKNINLPRIKDYDKK